MLTKIKEELTDPEENIEEKEDGEQSTLEHKETDNMWANIKEFIEVYLVLCYLHATLKCKIGFFFSWKLFTLTNLNNLWILIEKKPNASDQNVLLKNVFQV